MLKRVRKFTEQQKPLQIVLDRGAKHQLPKQCFFKRNCSSKYIFTFGFNFVKSHTRPEEPQKAKQPVVSVTFTNTIFVKISNDANDYLVLHYV